MKRLLTLALTLLISAQAFAFPLQHRRKDTATVIEGIPAIGVADGKITTNGCDGATLTCQCGAVGDSLALGACNGGTTIAEDAATGVYNLTVNAADIDNEKCIIKIVCSAGYIDQVVTIYTADYSSYEDITSMTATQPAVKHLGNTTGQGELIQGGASDGDGAVYTGDSTAAPAGTASGIVTLAGSNGAGVKTSGAGTGPGQWSVGGADGPGGFYQGGAGEDGLQVRANGAAYAATSSSFGAIGTSGYYGGTFGCSGANCIGLNLTANTAGSGGTAASDALKISGSASTTGTGYAVDIVGPSNSGAAGRPAVSIVGGASTYADPTGKGGSAISLAPGSSNAAATSWNPTILATNNKTDVLQLTCTGGTACDAAQLTGYGTGLALHIISGSGIDGSLDMLLERRDSTL